MRSVNRIERDIEHLREGVSPGMVGKVVFNFAVVLILGMLFGCQGAASGSAPPLDGPSNTDSTVSCPDNPRDCVEGDASVDTETSVWPDTDENTATDAGTSSADTGSDDAASVVPDVDSDGPPFIDTDTSNEPLVVGLGISKIAIYQAPELPLMVDWIEAASPYAVLAARKTAVVRVFVTPQPGWRKREVEARLHLSSSQLPTGAYYSEKKTIHGASSPGSLFSTFNIPIPAVYMTEGLAYQVSLHEIEDEVFEGTAERARWPAEGASALPVEEAGGLELVLVPIAYDEDGDGIPSLPDTSETAIEAIREVFDAFYPVARDGLEIRIAAPLSWQDPITPSGKGWSELLAELAIWKSDNEPTAKAYHIGLVAPDDSLDRFCRLGCNTGLAYLVEEPEDAFGKVAVVLGFDGGTAGRFMIHEVGHGHGIKHTPCGDVDDVDWDYPYNGGSIGVWGLDISDGELKDPALETDFMGYCEHQWVSDYVYGALQRWMQDTSRLSSSVRGLASEWRLFRMTDDSIDIGRKVTLAKPPFGTPIDVELYDSNIDLVGIETGFFIPHDPMLGGIFLVSEPSKKAFYLSLPGSPLISL